jgi:hypothetical protein
MSLYCKRCKQYNTQDSCFIKKLPNNKYYIDGSCTICTKTISKPLNKKQVKLLPKSIIDSNDYTVHKEYTNEKNGGILPLATLLPIILGGIGAISGVASSVINPLLESKKHAEQKRHNEALETAARGSGISDTIENKERTLSDIVNNLNTISDNEKRQLIKAFGGLGYTII